MEEGKFKFIVIVKKNRSRRKHKEYNKQHFLDVYTNRFQVLTFQSDFPFFLMRPYNRSPRKVEEKPKIPLPFERPGRYSFRPRRTCILCDKPNECLGRRYVQSRPQLKDAFVRGELADTIMEKKLTTPPGQLSRDRLTINCKNSSLQRKIFSLWQPSSQLKDQILLVFRSPLPLFGVRKDLLVSGQGASQKSELSFY